MGPIGSTVRSGGLTECTIGFDPNSKDYAMVKMEQNKADAEGRDPIYNNENWPKVADFIFERTDGVRFTLHPKHNDKMISVKLLLESMTPAPAPAAGMYKTDGPGTFQRGHGWNQLMEVKFKPAH